MIVSMVEMAYFIEDRLENKDRIPSESRQTMLLKGSLTHCSRPMTCMRMPLVGQSRSSRHA